MSSEEFKSLSSIKQQAEESKFYRSYRVQGFINQLNDAFVHLEPELYGATNQQLFSEKELACLAQCLDQHLATSELRMLSDTLAEMLMGR